MSYAARITQALLSFGEAELRVVWLGEQLQRWPAEHGARVLDDLAVASEAAAPDAREAMLVVAMFVAAQAEDSELLETLREQAHTHHLHSLSRVLRAPRSAAQLTAPPHTELPIPDYGTGRELTLGERRSLARRPKRELFDKLLLDPHPMVMRNLLINPKLTEDDVVRLATKRPARVEVLRELVQLPRWLKRCRVRQALILNPGTPLDITLPLLSVSIRAELLEVIRSTRCPAAVRVTAQELLDRRPPMEHRLLRAELLQ